MAYELREVLDTVRMTEMEHFDIRTVTLGVALRDLRAGGRSLWVLCVCLALGVALIAASAGLHRHVSDALLADARALLGGKFEL